MKPDTTTTYQWPASSAITRIDLRVQHNGESVAYVYADPGVASSTLHEIRAAIRLKGWGTLSDHREGRFGLRVSGIRDGDALLSMLQTNGYIPGEAQSHSEVNNARPKGILESIRNNSLRLSAITYALGDMLYFKGADNKFDKGMALSFGFGDGMLALFGGRDDDRQFTSLLGKLKTHMEQNGIEIPKNSAIEVETSLKPQGALHGASEFLHRHINSIKISSEVLGGGFVLRSGLKRNDLGKRNPLNIISGLVIMAGWAGALLTREKKPDREALQHADVADRVGSYIQEKPLRLAGYAGLTFNALKISDAVINRRATSKWNIAAVGSMVSANGLYAISNKTVGGDIKAQEMVSDVYSVAAQILNKQPGQTRERAIESTAQFLGERPEIKDTHQEIIARLKQEIAIQRQNPWFENIALAAHGGHAPAPHRESEVAPLPGTQVETANLRHEGKDVDRVANDNRLLNAASTR